MPRAADPARDKQVAEILKCGKDPVYFMKRYAKIQHPKKGLIPFTTYSFQDDCIAAFQSNRYNIVLKSRQLGLSTVTAIYALWLAIFFKDKTILVIATKLPTAMNFIKKVKCALDNLPPWLLLTSYEPTKQRINFANGSSITAIPTSDDAGRSEALSLLIVDEAAFIRDFESIWTGLYPTISTGGNAIIISTPNGVGGQYYKLWQSAVAGDNEFNTINLPWYVHPEHDQAWFDSETRNIAKRKISQEYLCDFISSGDTFLQPEELDYIREMIEPPKRREGPNMGVWVWSSPVPGRQYIISSDVARGDGADFSTFHIIDYDACEVVAEYMGKIPPDKLADLLMEYGKVYNTALICPERNIFGYFTCVKLRDSKYKRLYYRTMMGNPFTYIQTDASAVPGFETQGGTRPQVLGRLEELIRNKIFRSYSQRLYDQLAAFVWQGQKAQALRDAHDDLVMSAAIGVWLTNAGSTVKGLDNDHTLAMIKAIHVERRNTEALPGRINEAQPLVNPSIRGYTPGTVPSPHQGRRNDLTDYRWLLR